VAFCATFACAWAALRSALAESAAALSGHTEAETAPDNEAAIARLIAGGFSRARLAASTALLSQRLQLQVGRIQPHQG
jgi:hypothetical protein